MEAAISTGPELSQARGFAGYCMDTPKFIVAVNVGRLAKWLRVIGYHTLFVTDIDDSELLWMAEEEGRFARCPAYRKLYRRGSRWRNMAAEVSFFKLGTS